MLTNARGRFIRKAPPDERKREREKKEKRYEYIWYVVRNCVCKHDMTGKHVPSFVFVSYNRSILRMNCINNMGIIWGYLVFVLALTHGLPRKFANTFKYPTFPPVNVMVASFLFIFPTF